MSLCICPESILPCCSSFDFGSTCAITAGRACVLPDESIQSDTKCTTCDACEWKCNIRGLPDLEAVSDAHRPQTQDQSLVSPTALIQVTALLISPTFFGCKQCMIRTSNSADLCSESHIWTDRAQTSTNYFTYSRGATIQSLCRATVKMIPDFLRPTYKQYKTDSDTLATWLANTARTCGYPHDLLSQQTSSQKQPKLKG